MRGNSLGRMPPSPQTPFLWRWELSAASRWAQSGSFPHLDNSCRGKGAAVKTTVSMKLNKSKNRSKVGVLGRWI